MPFFQVSQKLSSPQLLRHQFVAPLFSVVDRLSQPHFIELLSVIALRQLQDICTESEILMPQHVT